MKVFILFILTCCTQFAASSQSTFYYYNKKFKRVETPSKGTYSVYVPKVNQVSKVVRIDDGKVIAEGVLFPTDTLAFDGKALFLDQDGVVKSVKFYKKGVPYLPISIDKDLKKTNAPTSWYLLTGESGEFCAYQKMNPAFGSTDDLLYASGNVLDVNSLALDGQITFYTQQGAIGDVKNYQNGQEQPFIVSTTDYKEPYETLGIISYSGGHLPNIDLEMAQFILKCKRAGADGVVGVKTSVAATAAPDITGTTQYSRELIIQGTIIRLKKKKEGE